MSQKLRLFVSSVQKELEDERVIVQNLVSTDSFLSAHCTPVLYEYEPASPDIALEGCLKSLDTCDVYLLMVGAQYGSVVGDVSITHAEYRRAKQKHLPVLAFIRGERTAKREDATTKFLAELETDGFKYKRFGNVIELQKEVRNALAHLLQDRFRISPTSDENQIAEQTIEATSTFESQPLMRLRWEDLDHEIARQLIAAAEKKKAEDLSAADLMSGALLRGLVWTAPDSGEHFATAAGIVLLAKDPSAVMPQCRILSDAYRGAEPDSNPRDHEDIRGPAAQIIERAIAFVDRNTRHPMKVVGLTRLRLNEYPVEALRESLVNAVAHRRYEDAGRKIALEVFSDRIVVSSPGMPPEPITVASLRKGTYRPCSRNPVLAQSLSYFHRIEERGSGFRRMREEMLNHGLEQPLLGTSAGYFQVTFPGPADNLDRLAIPALRSGVAPSIEAQMNARQRRILTQALEAGSVTTQWCMEELSVARDTAHRDLTGLVKLGLLVRHGSGRAAKYVPKEDTT